MSYRYKEGNIPIILLSLHGGGTFLDCKKRMNILNGKQFVVKNDAYTKKITLETYSNMLSLGYKPYLIVNNIHRKYIDLNRFMNSSCNEKCNSCMYQYILFHDNLMKCVLNIIDKHGKCFIFDIHGNQNTHNMIQFGYGLSIDELKQNKLDQCSLYSVKNNNSNIDEYIFKNKSLSYYYKDLFPNIFPTYNKIDDTYIKNSNSKYYAGKQFIIKKYSDICDVCLVELSPELRIKPKSTSKKLAQGLINYYKTL